MPRQSRLKVYRTTIGFHDAYVAAPSQKAALAAWKTDKNLFAIDAAELVEDDELKSEALASPGVVILKARGTQAEHLAAAKPVALTTGKAAPQPPLPKPRSPRANRRKRRPDRSEIDAIDAESKALEQERAKAEAELQSRQQQLDRERDELRRKHQSKMAALNGRLAKARERYEAALRQWQED